MKRSVAALLVAASLGAASAAVHAQAPPKPKTRDIALMFLAGRWARPVTCEMADGTHVERAEAVSFKIAPGAGSGRTAIRATYYGINAPGAVRCWNLIERSIPDRRGVVYLHMRSFNREDVGMSDFRRMLGDGELTYHVTRGQLRERAIGETSDDGWKVTPIPEGTPFHVGEARPGSDGVRLFRAAGALPERPGPSSARLMRFSLGDPAIFAAVFLEGFDPRRHGARPDAR